MSYNINKGIGRTVEFKGLKAQYLFIFAGGLLGTLIFVMILYMAGVNPYICLFIGAGGASLIVWQTFTLNKKHSVNILLAIGYLPSTFFGHSQIKNHKKHKNNKTFF